jgi:hypothetical protein
VLKADPANSISPLNRGLPVAAFVHRHLPRRTRTIPPLIDPTQPSTTSPDEQLGRAHHQYQGRKPTGPCGPSRSARSESVLPMPEPVLQYPCSFSTQTENVKARLKIATTCCLGRMYGVRQLAMRLRPQPQRWRRSKGLRALRDFYLASPTGFEPVLPT